MNRERGSGKASDPACRLVRTASARETQQVGEKLAEMLRAPAVVLLCGSLGIGKTTLARGLATGLGIKDPDQVHSPSFTIVNVYQGRWPVYHVDLYRLGGRHDIDTIGLEDFLGQDGITIVEWGERLSSAVDAALVVELEDAGGDCRTMRIWGSETSASKTRRSKARQQRFGRKV
jgi:tRNA threonylcarbamoyladenosine biosynthesis protein TsaE